MDENARSSLWAKIEELFSIDLRSLALFRICLGVIILIDLGIRLTALEAHYTDSGVLPRSLVYEQGGQTLPWSIHFLSGRTDVQALIFLIQGLFGFALLVGYKTWIVTVVNWYLMCSLFVRNLLVLQGGDVLLLLLLFWSIFLPLGARWSLDRLWEPKDLPVPKRAFTGATAALLLQVVIVYVFAAIFKWNRDWLSGEAVYFALNLDSFAKPVGVWLRQFYPLMIYTSYVVLAFEVLCPLLAFSPFATATCRIIAFATATVMHLGFDLGLTLGLFAYISITSWMVFIPSQFWDWFDRRRGIATTPRDTTLRGDPITNAIALMLIAYIFAWNVRSVNYNSLDQYYPKHFNAIAKVLHLQQMWNMFYIPLRDDGWFIVPGKLVNGSAVDLQRGGAPLNWDKPPLVSDTYIDQRWRKYLLHLIVPKSTVYVPYYARYLCHQWNQSHQGEEKLKALQIVFILHRIYSGNHIGPSHKIIMWNENCESEIDPAASPSKQ